MQNHPWKSGRERRRLLGQGSESGRYVQPAVLPWQDSSPSLDVGGDRRAGWWPGAARPRWRLRPGGASGAHNHEMRMRAAGGRDAATRPEQGSRQPCQGTYKGRPLMDGLK